MANKKITDLMSGTPTRDSYLESATDVGGTMVSRKFKVGAVADVNNVQIASEYDDTATYAYGDYCIKDGVLYRCTTAISVAEAWTVAHWTAVMVTGEYKRVRIMTKAQFDLLSNDEKDGFIYVSDYPTKIQDLDNVTLTTSDDNKLLGVSVSGSDISVGAVDVNAVSISTSGAIANVSQSNASKLNKLVIVNLNLVLTSATSLYALLCTMSKKPISEMQIFLYSSPNTAVYECHFGADGTILWWNNNVVASNTTIIGQFVYFTND